MASPQVIIGGAFAALVLLALIGWVGAEIWHTLPDPPQDIFHIPQGAPPQ